MRLLSVFVTFCYVVTQSQAYPYTSQPFYPGPCSSLRLNCDHNYGSFCPQCDNTGNFLPQQCWQSTGHCWCVDVISGQEIPNTNTGPGVPPVDCNAKPEGPWYCPDGWTSFDNMCFSFISTPKKWIEAEVYCQFDGGNLASVHSEDESHFIMSLTRGYTQDFPQTWLGGFDAIHPGYWMWSDGSDFNYENWYNSPYENNKADDDEDDNDQDDEKHEGDEKDEDNEKDQDDEKGQDYENDDKDKDHPDNSHEESNEAKRKNCLKMNYEYELKWSYDSCTDYLPFICARKAHRIYF